MQIPSLPVAAVAAWKYPPRRRARRQLSKARRPKPLRPSLPAMSGCVFNRGASGERPNRDLLCDSPPSSRSHGDATGVIAAADENAARQYRTWGLGMTAQTQVGIRDFQHLQSIDPCGLWQAVQPSRSAGCSNTNGPCLLTMALRAVFIQARHGQPASRFHDVEPVKSWYCTEKATRPRSSRPARPTTMFSPQPSIT